ncbi:MAG: ATP-binding protein [Nitrospirota bacterium]|nr:ATP-binding protein [Nitrospirota bacterium]
MKPVPSLKHHASSYPLDGDFHRYVVESMRSGVITIDKEGRITTINVVACRILGLERARAIGRHCAEILEDYMDIAQLLLDAFHKEYLPCRAEMEVKKKDSRGKTLGFTLSLVRNDENEVIGSAMFFKDLTHVEVIEEQERLKDRLMALGQMAAGMAHEIRNPLAGIEITVDLIKRKTKSKMPDLDEYLSSVVDEVRRLNRTVTDCLEFVRPLELELEPTDIGLLIDEVFASPGLVGDLSRVKINKELDDTVPLVMLDVHRMRQVFSNLISNACQAMPSGGELTVRISTAPAYVAHVMANMGKTAAKGGSPIREFDTYAVISIMDTGKGIAPDILDKIFHPFFTTKITGSGIGLAITQKIVDSHGGVIDIESTVGKGTTFHVKLPMVQAG